MISETHNITAMSQVTSHIHTLHTVMRQEANPRGGGRVALNLGEQLTVHYGATTKIAATMAIKTETADIFNVYGLEYNEQAAGRDGWYGMMAPFLTFTTCFNLRMNEVRNGCDQFTVSKDRDTNTIRSVRVSQYGLSGKHHMLLSGITYPPIKRSSMAQSIGPMTQAISLLRQRGRMNYSDKWTRALSRTLAHIPRSQEIVGYLQGRNAADAAPMLTTLADILLITGSRMSNKAHFPISMFTANLTPELLASYSQEKAVAPNGQARFQAHVLTDGFKINYSGKGAFKCYSDCCKSKFTMYINTDATKAREIVFHSIWGSH